MAPLCDHFDWSRDQRYLVGPLPILPFRCEDLDVEGRRWICLAAVPPCELSGPCCCRDAARCDQFREAK